MDDENANLFMAADYRPDPLVDIRHVALSNAVQVCGGSHCYDEVLTAARAFEAFLRGDG